MSKRFLVVILLATIIIGCESKPDQQDTPQAVLGLKDYYKDYFTMGVAVNLNALEDSSATLIKQHFSSLTAENAMKMGPIHPKEDSFYWKDADQIIAFARANQMKVRGHALCWHTQSPDWLFTDSQGKQISKEVLYERMKTHISTVVNRYKDDVYAWDVVNEAISDNDNEIYRKSKFYEIAGEEYIAKAFEFAREADPNAKLFYNDYSVVNPVKREKIYTLIKTLKSAGVPIDGIGIQGHWSIFSPTAQIVDETIQKFADLDILIQITELDISVYKSESNTRNKTEADIDEFTRELEDMQVVKYDSLFQILRNNKDKISAVTFWNVTDKYSWLDHFPVRGRKNYPLLFDRSYRPKKAYDKIVNFENQKPS